MFIYLNKKIAIPNGIKLRCCQWNQEQGWIACGGEGGLLKVLKLESAGTGRERGIAGVSNLTMNQTLEGHTQAVVCAAWNDVYKKLTTSDETGLIIVWMLHNGMWFEEMINNRNKSVVRDMKWCADGMKICICYEDGAVIVGSVDGNRLWGKELKMKLQFCEWSPDAKQILFVTPQGEVHVFDALGNFISQCPLFSEDSSARIAGVAWYNQLEGLVDEAAPSIAIVFETGRVQLMTSTQDEKPILIDTGLRPASEAKIGNKVHIAWNSNGSVLAVGGVLDSSSSTTSEDKNVSQMQFYDAFGRHLRTLKLPGAAVSGLAWEGGSLRIALAVESFLYFANIRPDYKWGYFANTLVYAYTRADRAEHCVTLHDTVTGNKYTKYVKKLLQIKAAGDYCVLATRTGLLYICVLILLYKAAAGQSCG
jgi:WD repeat-containing protein 35